MLLESIITNIVAGSSLVSALILRWLDKRKGRAEASMIEANLQEKLMTNFGTELKHKDSVIQALRSRETEQETAIEGLRTGLEKCRMDNKVCLERNRLWQIHVSSLQKLMLKSLPDMTKLGTFVLDDDPGVTMTFLTQLERSPFLDVSVFNDAAPFLERVLQLRPKILIIDYYLKGGESCLEMVNQIQAQKEYKPLIIIMSKDDSKEVKAEMQRHGLENFFVKESLYIFDIVAFVVSYAENILT